ncbi:MAG TPA: hypothetical protein PLA90_00965 [Candidatus Sumerlaeota bacterium]|nr:hypothetical protein [Candidatus Sumerlaeota bacterium]HPS00091.1 hypothetical protein [Candidatus Sumerlaeota bacterium]
MEIELDGYLSGGYFLTRPVDRQSWQSAQILPDRILSFSQCLFPRLPAPWMFDWMLKDEQEAFRQAADSGISPKGTLAARKWTTRHYDADMAHSGLFYRLETARDFVREFLSHNPDWTICGLGLHSSLAKRFLQEAIPPAPPNSNGADPTDGVNRAIRSGLPLANGGVPLGFELLGFDFNSYNLEHSWLCNGLEVDFHENPGITLGKFGLIEKFEDARACADRIVRENIQAEPGLWLPWLIVQYPQTERSTWKHSLMRFFPKTHCT